MPRINRRETVATIISDLLKRVRKLEVTSGSGGGSGTDTGDVLIAGPATGSHPGDAEADGSSGTASDTAHKHAREPWGTAADVTASAPGDAALGGVSGKTADIGHRHPREAWGLAADIHAVGAVAAPGASGKVADAGHVHPPPTGAAAADHVARAHQQAAAQGISDSTWTQATLDHVDYDTGGDFAGSAYTAAVTGMYDLSWGAEISTASGRFFTAVAINGVRTYIGPQVPAPSGAVTRAQSGGSQTIHLNAGDVVTLWVYQDSGAAHNLDIGDGISGVHMELSRVTVGVGDSAWINIAGGVGYQNGWSDFGGVEVLAAYRKDANGFVHTRGFMKSPVGWAGPAFTFPPDYRPATGGGAGRVAVTARAQGNQFAEVDINYDGTVLPAGIVQSWVYGTGLDTTRSQWVSLDNITFLAEN